MNVDYKDLGASVKALSPATQQSIRRFAVALAADRQGAGDVDGLLTEAEKIERYILEGKRPPSTER